VIGFLYRTSREAGPVLAALAALGLMCVYACVGATLGFLAVGLWELLT
jgi:hypothetical protein